MPLRRYAGFYRDAIAFDVAGGVLGLSTGYAWSGRGDGWTFANLAGTLRRCACTAPGERGDFLAVPNTALTGSASTWRRARSRSGSCRCRARASP